MVKNHAPSSTGRERPQGRLNCRQTDTSRKGRLSVFGRTLLDVLMPPSCLACRTRVQSADTLCPDCWKSLSFIERPYCDRLGIPFVIDIGIRPVISVLAARNPPVYSRARAACLFKGTARTLVHNLKYRNQHSVSILMARLMLRGHEGILAEADLIVPIPLHWTRLWRRRCNQSVLIAQKLSEISGIPVALGIVSRKRRTRQQVGLSRSQRRKNVRDAFTVPPAAVPRIQGARILLVDDVITTGATIESCTKTLLKAGAGAVDVLAFAKVTDYIDVLAFTGATDSGKPATHTQVFNATSM